MEDNAEVLVLHTLRVAGVSQLPRLSRRTGMPSDVLARNLRALEATGMVRIHDGSLPGWGLTPSGRSRGEELLAAELARTGARGFVEAVHEQFLELNGAVLGACTDWQIIAGSNPLELNDHANREYDESVLERLIGLHADADDVLSALTSRLPRFDTYLPRLSNALAQARTGGVDWVTKPTIDSYHTVWFELHEDLLATLGRSRSAEAPGRKPRNPPPRDHDLDFPGADRGPGERR